MFFGYSFIFQICSALSLYINSCLMSRHVEKGFNHVSSFLTANSRFTGKIYTLTRGEVIMNINISYCSRRNKGEDGRKGGRKSNCPTPALAGGLQQVDRSGLLF